MLIAAHPNWLGSPQHVIAGVILSFLIASAARRFMTLERFVAFALALGLTSTAEILVELFEYPVVYGSHVHLTAYYDTLADMASTVVGAVVGGIVGASLFASRP